MPIFGEKLGWHRGRANRGSSLRGTLTLGVVLTLTICNAAVFYSSNQNAVRALELNFRDQAAILAGGVGAVYSELTPRGSYVALRDLILRASRLDFVTAVGLADADGRFLYHSHSEQIGRFINPPIQLLPNPPKNSRVLVRGDEVTVVKLVFFANPETERPNTAYYGYVLVSESFAAARRTLTERVVLAGLVAFAAVLLVGLAAFFVTSRVLVRPLQRLVDLTTRIASGERGVRITITALDEVGRLGHAFNDMADAIDRHERLLTEGQEELRQARDQLEERVRERTSELLEANERLAEELISRERAEEERKVLEMQLAQSQKMEAIGMLAGGIAHEFNNILQAVAGYTQVLLAGKAEGASDYGPLKIIERSTIRASDLTKQLLLFSHKEEHELTKVDLNRVVRESVRLLASVIPRMIRVELALAERLRVVQADRAQMQQILMNLALNSRDAMPLGGLLSIKTENVAPGDPACIACPLPHEGCVRLTVTDTGQGMDEETRRHLFEPFFTTKGFGRGTGLGLATVYGIVKSHKGWISCSSEPNAGTTFTLCFPAQAGEEGEESEAPSFSEPQPGGAGQTILIVDDEPHLRDLCSEVLSSAGYSVRQADDGESAIELYEHGGIDLVILDLNMPGMGGVSCLQRLQTLDPKVRVIVTTGYSTEVPADGAKALGATGYLNKPFTLDELRAEVRRALS